MSGYRGLKSVAITDTEVQISKADLDKLPLWKGSPPKDAKAGDLFARRDSDGWATGIVKLRGSLPLMASNYELVCADRGPKPEPVEPAKKKKAKKAAPRGEKKVTKKKK